MRKSLHNGASFTVWLTGLPCSGKSSLAFELQQRLKEDLLPSVILDGDELRKGLNKDLDFSKQGRSENVRRTAEVCKLIMNGGIIAIAALVSPFEKEREMVKQYLGEQRFILVYLDCPLEICQERDVKGLYKQARDGKVKNFTGIDSPFEVPLKPHLVLETHLMPLSTCADSIYNLIGNLL